MELTNLLNQAGWASDAQDLSREAIERSARRDVVRDIKGLYRNYRNGLLLNTGFLGLTFLVYWFNQSPAFLLPVILIAGCFAFIIANLLRAVIKPLPVNSTLSVRAMMKRALDINERTFKRQCRYQAVFLTISFIGGLTLGLAFQGWTLAEYLDKPIIFPVILVLSAGFYLSTRSASFQSFSRWLNPSYHLLRQSLEQRLALLDE